MAGFRHGLDLKAPAGTPVYAPIGGRVEVGDDYPRVHAPSPSGVSLVGDDGYRSDLTRIPPGSKMNLALKIFARTIATHSLRKSLELRIARGQ